MKTKISISFLAVFFTVLSSFGQDPGLIPSLIGGVNFAKFKSDQIENSSKPGFTLGFGLTAQLGDKLDLITEYTFATKKMTTTAREYDYSAQSFSDMSYDLKFSTLSWSVLANYYIKAPNLSLQAGPLFAYNLVSPELPTDIYYGTSDVLSENIDGFNFISNISGLDYGLIMGISGGTEALRINLRYHLGFRDYYKKIDNTGNGYAVKCNYIELTIAYSFLNVRVVRG